METILKTNKIIILGIAGWILMAGFSILQYLSITNYSCYFLSSWPFCAANLIFWQKLVQGMILSFIMLFLIFSGKYFFNFLKDKEMAARKSYFFLASFFILAAFLTIPFASGDMIYYFNAGKAINNGYNLYVGQWPLINNFFYPPTESIANGIMYGPIALDVFSLVHFISNDNVFVFSIIWKMLMTAVFVLCGLLVWKLLSIYSPNLDKKWFYLFWFLQPLFLFEWIANGHFDGMWLLFVLLAFISIRSKKWQLAIPCLAISIWIKFIPALIATWFLLLWWQEVNKNNWKAVAKDAIIGLSVSSVITYFAWTHYWQGWQVFSPLLLQSKWAVSSIFAATYYTLRPLFDVAFQENSHWMLTRLAHLILLFAAIYLIYPYFKKIILVIVRKDKFDEIWYYQAIFISLLIYTLIWQKSFWPWYLAWLMPIGLIAYLGGKQNIHLNKIIAWISLSPLLFYIPQMVANNDTHHLWFFYYVVLVIMIYPIFNLLKWRKNDYQIN